MKIEDLILVDLNYLSYSLKALIYFHCVASNIFFCEKFLGEIVKLIKEILMLFSFYSFFIFMVVSVLYFLSDGAIRYAYNSTKISEDEI